jgi:hypothetical protein
MSFGQNWELGKLEKASPFHSKAKQRDAVLKDCSPCFQTGFYDFEFCTIFLIERIKLRHSGSLSLLS